ncbi:Spt4-domain-containing protein [Acephala macrosclerotiorum]|nr:Spt4-domain-containing protein [Acephala macrosclerotiorum]
MELPDNRGIVALCTDQSYLVIGSRESISFQPRDASSGKFQPRSQSNNDPGPLRSTYGLQSYPQELLRSHFKLLNTTQNFNMTDNFVAPGQQRNLRACMVCSIVMTQTRFLKEGCPNCEEFLHLEGSMDAIVDCTSQVFEGLISLADPSRSWVAKWQRLDGYVKGVYATKVSGILPDEVVAVMEDEARIKYIPRDGSATEAD